MSKVKGDAAERRAEELLKSRGFSILERNFRTRMGEIDLVARDGDTAVFVEVRSRASSAFGAPEETVTGPKRRRLILTAQAWAQNRAWEGPMRFDVVAITPGETLHIPGAFDASGAW